MNWYDRHKDGWILKACCSFKWQTAMVLSLFPPSRLLHSFVRAFCSSSHHSIHQWCWGQIWRQASPPVFYFTLALSPCCSFVKTVSCAKYDKTNSEKGYYFFSSFFFFFHWWWNKHAVRQCQGKYPGMTFSTDWVSTPQPICCTKFRLQQPQEVRQSNKVQFTAVKYSACVKTDIEIHWLDGTWTIGSMVTFRCPSWCNTTCDLKTRWHQTPNPLEAGETPHSSHQPRDFYAPTLSKPQIHSFSQCEGKLQSLIIGLVNFPQYGTNKWAFYEF